MTDNHEPKSCAACGAVNPWMNESCRVCGEPVTNEDRANPYQAPAAEQGDPASNRPEPAPEKRQGPKQLGGWNPRWVLLGGALFALVFMGGEKLIEHLIVANDPQLKQVIEEQLQKQEARGDSPTQEVSEGDKQRLRSALVANRLLVFCGLLLLLVTPLLVGGVVGYLTVAVRNGAVACGLGMLAVMLMSTSAVLYGLVFGLVYAGLGALGALTGSWYRMRRLNRGHLR